ncbi:hypothetical protein PPGU19_070080 (plasmid) [Paraburkholderia sp. PGU19]|uniref:HNH endonuclease n=1 Tax=Paraburkholderia sp. PGU19 TaxID=2735434 RepID=UPI0015DAF0FA|nr:HNH endonuclease [Paraburkholderia sp. PGU19]BCG02440.1 hypothetical protein PPGU19_070080 [Paraburkholderia sp. PGU19]
MTTLDDLKPTEKQLVDHVCDELNIPRGSVFNWCFGTADGPNVMFQWWQFLAEQDGVVSFEEGTADWMEKNRWTAHPNQLSRAQAVINLVLNAYLKKRPLHIAIVDGTIEKVNQRETSTATKRQLDGELWWPHHRDPVSGNIIVLRGVPQPADFDPQKEILQPERASIQAESPPPPVIKTKTTVFDRDPAVAKQVKYRARDGLCERCREQGFETHRGGFYLEAHHVIPLNCDGPDLEWNVVAICADCHKKAHFSKERKQIRDDLIMDVLIPLFPDKMDQLDELTRKMDFGLHTERNIESDAMT